MDKVFTSLAVSVDGFIVLLGDGRRFFQELPAHIGLSLVEAVPAPGVTHLRYRIEK